MTETNDLFEILWDKLYPLFGSPHCDIMKSHIKKYGKAEYQRGLNHHTDIMKESDIDCEDFMTNNAKLRKKIQHLTGRSEFLVNEINAKHDENWRLKENMAMLERDYKEEIARLEQQENILRESLNKKLREEAEHLKDYKCGCIAIINENIELKESNRILKHETDVVLQTVKAGNNAEKDYISKLLADNAFLRAELEKAEARRNEAETYWQTLREEVQRHIDEKIRLAKENILLKKDLKESSHYNAGIDAASEYYESIIDDFKNKWIDPQKALPPIGSAVTILYNGRVLKNVDVTANLAHETCFSFRAEIYTHVVNYKLVCGWAYPEKSVLDLTNETRREKIMKNARIEDLHELKSKYAADNKVNAEISIYAINAMSE